MLNKRTDKTKGVIHLMVTTLCSRNCKFCCNKQYDIDCVPTVKQYELGQCHTICITGGEPFQFSNPCEIARLLKAKHPNILNAYVYTNAIELLAYLSNGGKIYSIDGLSVSVKNRFDAYALNDIIANYSDAISLPSNRLFVFNNMKLRNDSVEELFEIIPRKWQSHFEPAEDSIFRRI